jgi:DNA-binding winged helix-turn-helix (wHTH) protein
MQFLFADHTLDIDRRELRRGSQEIAVEPQVFDLLVYLVENRERVVTKDDLLDAVWAERFVSESNLTTRINAARKAIGDSGEEQRLIRTVPRKGFRFVGVVSTAAENRDVPASTATMRIPLPLPDKPSISVLPFENMSGDPEQEYFADGMVEEIITGAVAVPAAVRHRSQFNFHVQGPCGRCEAGRSRAGGSLRSRRQRAQIG